MSDALRDYYSMSAYEITCLFDREIPDDHKGAFYSWIEETHNGAFSKAYSKFYTESLKAEKDGNLAKQSYAFIEFIKTMVGFAPEYRKEKKLDETEIFLDSLTK